MNTLYEYEDKLPPRYKLVDKFIRDNFPNHRFTIAGGCLRDYIFGKNLVIENDVDVFIEYDDEVDFEYDVLNSNHNRFGHIEEDNPLDYITIRTGDHVDSYGNMSQNLAHNNDKAYDILSVADFYLPPENTNQGIAGGAYAIAVNVIAVNVKEETFDFGKTIAENFDINVCQFYCDDGDTIMMLPAAYAALDHRLVEFLHPEITQKSAKRAYKNKAALGLNCPYVAPTIGGYYITDEGKSLGLSLREEQRRVLDIPEFIDGAAVG